MCVCVWEREQERSGPLPERRVVQIEEDAGEDAVVGERRGLGARRVGALPEGLEPTREQPRREVLIVDASEEHGIVAELQAVYTSTCTVQYGGAVRSPSGGDAMTSV